MARYIALADGCVGAHYVRAGESFDYDGPAPQWARPVKDKPVEPAAKAPAPKKAAAKSSSVKSGGKEG